jgi:hypothetical protein
VNDGLVDVDVYSWDQDFIFYPLTKEARTWLWHQAPDPGQVWIGFGLLIAKGNLEKILKVLDEAKLKILRPGDG